MSGKKTLLLDDAPGIRMTMSALLEEVGVEVIEAESIADARAKMKTSEIELFVLDLHLGDGVSTQLVPEIKRDFPDAKVVLLTGSGTLDHSMHGIDRLITKGGDPMELVRILEKVLRSPLEI
jgi:DNA-binding NtrC family response regulator